MSSNSSSTVPASSTIPQTTSSNSSSVVSSLSSPTPTGGPPDGDNGETRIIDDTDPSIVYSASGWNATSDTNAYNRTIHQTSCNSCTATLLFNGTGLSLNSLISPSGASFVAILDGTPAGPFQLYNPTESTTVVYSIEGLRLGQHNVTFNKSSNDPNDQTLFNIDSITIISRPGVSVTGSTSFIAPTASGRSTIQQTQTGTSPTSSAVPSAQASSPPPIGAIIGGTVGGALVIIVIAAWWVLVRRKRSQSKARARRF